MIRQYNPQRFRIFKGKRVGTVPVGTILYIQDNVRPFGWSAARTCRNPWIVTAWLNREYYTIGPTPVKHMNGGHLAVVKSLRNGEEKRIADWILLECIGAGFERAGRWCPKAA